MRNNPIEKCFENIRLLHYVRNDISDTFQFNIQHLKFQSEAKITSRIFVALAFTSAAVQDILMRQEMLRAI